MPVMVSEAARLSHARKRPQRPVRRAPASSGKRSSSASPAVVEHQRRGPARAGRAEQRPRPAPVRAANLGARRPAPRPRRRRDLEDDALLDRPRPAVRARSAARAARSPRRPRPSAPAPRSRAPDRPASSPPRAPRCGRARRDPRCARAPRSPRRAAPARSARGGRRRRQGTPRRRRSSGRSPGARLASSAFGTADSTAAIAAAVRDTARKLVGGDAPAMRRRLIPVQLAAGVPVGERPSRRPLPAAETRRAVAPDSPGTGALQAPPDVRHCVCWKLEGCRGGANNWGWDLDDGVRGLRWRRHRDARWRSADQLELRGPVRSDAACAPTRSTSIRPNGRASTPSSMTSRRWRRACRSPPTIRSSFTWTTRPSPTR